MNKLIISLFFLAVSAGSFSQSPNTSDESMKVGYLKKSRGQNTVAWILLGGGAALTVTGYVIGLNSAGDQLASAFGSGHNDNSFVAGSICFFTGAGAMLASIPVFIASSRNKKKSMSLSFKNEKVSQIQKNSFVYRPIPSLSFKISL